jgi:hypothetical protein
MQFDLDLVGRVLVALIISSSVLIVAAAIAWRLVMKPTLRALLEYRAATRGDPVLTRRVAELEEEVRALKDRVPALPEGNPTRLTGGDVPWRGMKEKA